MPQEPKKRKPEPWRTEPTLPANFFEPRKAGPRVEYATQPPGLAAHARFVNGEVPLSAVPMPKSTGVAVDPRTPEGQVLHAARIANKRHVGNPHRADARRYRTLRDNAQQMVDTIEPVGRTGSRLNPDGSRSTHLMAREYIPGEGWVAFPTLFQDGNQWVDMSDMSQGFGKAYEEAKRRGEVYNFGENEMAATMFADEGAWKDKMFIPDVDTGMFRRGIVQPENSGEFDYMAMNPTSSATGAYQILYNEHKDELKKMGINSRGEFARSKKAQEEIMGRRIERYREDAQDLYNEYKPQLGDKFNFSPAEIMALVHFAGREGTRQYLASIREGKEAPDMPGTNLTQREYLDRFNKGLSLYQE